MGKGKKLKMPNVRHGSFEAQLVEGKVAKQKNRHKVHLRAEESAIVDSRTSKKILAAAKQQQLECGGKEHSNLNGKKEGANNLHVNHNLSSDESDLENDDMADVCENAFMDDIHLEEEDIKAFERFQNVNNDKRTVRLTDLIMDKIQEKQADIQSKLSNAAESIVIEEIDPRIKELYEGVREVMKRYRSGKVPKAFKVIPKFRNWEQILFITEPHNWSAAAVFQGTRAFSAGLSQAMAQRFYNLVLLPRIRDDLCEYKKLNVHLYNALKRALFKPAAFMKGIILPLLECGDCTLREAIIFGSVIAKNSVPILHSAACLLKICEMAYTGANSIFIRYFLDKRYALPYRVIDAAVFHFLRFENDKRQMTVLWHQSLLTFVQRYKNDISSEQKEALFDLLRKQFHPKITPEIRRELQAAKCRDIEMMECNDNDMPNPSTIQMFTDKDVDFNIQQVIN